MRAQSQSIQPVRLLATMAGLVLSGAALAHPDHGEVIGFVAGFNHPVHGLDHLLAMLAMLAVGVLAVRAGGRMTWALPLSFILAMIAGAGLGLAGMATPGVEPMIAASVLVLGLLMAKAARVGVAVIPLVAVFALFHGAAHGAAAAAGSELTGYFAGFTLATLALHAIGVAMGYRLRDSLRRMRLAGVPVAVSGALFMIQALAS